MVRVDYAQIISGVMASSDLTAYIIESRPVLHNGEFGELNRSKGIGEGMARRIHAGCNNRGPVIQQIKDGAQIHGVKVGRIPAEAYFDEGVWLHHSVHHQIRLRSRQFKGDILLAGNQHP
jgi:hypothetical protein